LEELFAEHAAVRVLEADAAQLDWGAELSGGPKPHVVAGNLPYQITGRLIEKAVGMAPILARAVFMVQREVADRLIATASTGNYGVLSVFTQAAFSVERAITVSRGAFMPQPRVDSAVVVLTPHATPRAAETPVFRDVVKRAFGQRRKKLRNAWRGLAKLDADAVARCAEQAGVDLNSRAETLAVEDFARMADATQRALAGGGGAPES
jgi:16S rRNA (adenine1518-N6/adenine1519-N6)-dimethyltransferase